MVGTSAWIFFYFFLFRGNLFHPIICYFREIRSRCDGFSIFFGIPTHFLRSKTYSGVLLVLCHGDDSHPTMDQPGGIVRDMATRDKNVVYHPFSGHPRSCKKMPSGTYKKGDHGWKNA